MAIVVHHLMHSRSLRVLWLLEELGLDYELVRYERDKDFRAPPSLEKAHPLGRAPVVEVDGVVLVESGAILEHFAEREQRLRPSTPEGLREYRFFLHYAEGSAMPPLLVQLLVERVRSAPMPALVKPIARRNASEIERNYSGPAIERHFGFVERSLSERAYFAGGEFSAADIQMFYPVEAALARSKDAWPLLRAWRARVTARLPPRGREGRPRAARPLSAAPSLPRPTSSPDARARATPTRRVSRPSPALGSRQGGGLCPTACAQLLHETERHAARVDEATRAVSQRHAVRHEADALSPEDRGAHRQRSRLAGARSRSVTER